MITPLETRPNGGRPGRRGAFTLIELLVVMVIIALLGAMVLGALFSAYDTAKVAKTKATISKIHNQLVHRWDSYRTRRLPISIQSGAETPQQFAARRLRALWELQRVEMPDDASDLNFTPDPAVFPGLSFAEINSNPLRKAYVDQLVRYGKSPTGVGGMGPTNVSAECLYLMVTVGMNAEDEVRFLDNEIGDTDGDGIPEFIDGWGRPIRWIRWAPGYVPRRGADTDAQRDDRMGVSGETFLPDPFDVRGLCRPGGMTMVGPGVPPIPNNPPPNNTASGQQYVRSDPERYGFKLMPLVYSAGPDGEYGVAEPVDDPNVSSQTLAWNPYSLYPETNVPYLAVDPQDSSQKFRGTPIRGIEGGGHMDNITNHRLGNR